MSAVTRAFAVLFALTWIILPGFGLIDLAVTIRTTTEWEPVVVLEAGWGLLVTVFVGAAFVTLAARPRDPVAPVHIAVVTSVLTVAAFAGSEPRVLWLAAAMLIQCAIVVVLAWRMTVPSLGSIRVSWPLAVIAVIGAAPWLAFALDMFAANRTGRQPVDLTNGINHWAVQGALGLTLIAVSALASVWPVGRRYMGICVGVTAVHLGVVCLAHPFSAGAPGRTWSVLMAAWGVGVALLSWRSSTGASAPALAAGLAVDDGQPG